MEENLEDNKKKLIFISHCHLDGIKYLYDNEPRFWQGQIKFLLETVYHNKLHHCDYFIDFTKIKPGQSIPEKVRDALAKADYMVAFVSKNYLQSSWCLEEIEFFCSKYDLENNRRLILKPVGDQFFFEWKNSQICKKFRELEDEYLQVNPKEIKEFKDYNNISDYSSELAEELRSIIDLEVHGSGYELQNKYLGFFKNIRENWAGFKTPEPVPDWIDIDVLQSEYINKIKFPQINEPYGKGSPVHLVKEFIENLTNFVASDLNKDIDLDNLLEAVSSLFVLLVCPGWLRLQSGPNSLSKIPFKKPTLPVGRSKPDYVDLICLYSIALTGVQINIDEIISQDEDGLKSLNPAKIKLVAVRTKNIDRVKSSSSPSSKNLEYFKEYAGILSEVFPGECFNFEELKDDISLCERIRGDVSTVLSKGKNYIFYFEGEKEVVQDFFEFLCGEFAGRVGELMNCLVLEGDSENAKYFLTDTFSHVRQLGEIIRGRKKNK